MKKEEIENNEDDESTILGPRGIMLKNYIFGEDDSKPVGTRIPSKEEHEWKTFKQICNHLGMKVSDLFLIMLKQNNRDYETLLPISDKLGYDPVNFYNQTRDQLRDAIKKIDEDQMQKSSKVQHQVIDDIGKSVHIPVE